MKRFVSIVGMRNPEHREIERRIADTLEEIRILRVDARENLQEVRDELRVYQAESRAAREANAIEMRRLHAKSDEHLIALRELRGSSDEQLRALREMRGSHEEQLAELRALRETSDRQTEELRLVSATNQIQTDALRVALERIHEDERGQG